MTKPDLTRAIEEVKRVDHLYFVTLKYTRTADVILNTIKRIISAIEFGAEDILEHMHEKNRLKEIPPTNKERVALLKRYGLEEDDIEFYNFLKRIERSNYTGREEYRKHVTLITNFVEVDIVLLGEYFDNLKNIMSKLNRVK
jgi:hypothetical protein